MSDGISRSKVLAIAVHQGQTPKLTHHGFSGSTLKQLPGSTIPPVSLPGATPSSVDNGELYDISFFSHRVRDLLHRVRFHALQPSSSYQSAVNSRFNHRPPKHKLQVSPDSVNRSQRCRG